MRARPVAIAMGVGTTGAGPDTARPRYRHPGDVLRLMVSGLALVLAVAVAAAAREHLLGPSATPVSGLEPDTAGGRLLVGLVQATAAAGVAALVVATLWHRRFRLFATLAVGGLAAGAAYTLLDDVLVTRPTARLTTNLGIDAFLTGAHFPSPAWFAGGVAVTIAAAPWLARPWRRAAWVVLALAAGARVLTGTALPAAMVLAYAVGAVLGAGLLVAFGAPDRRIGPAEVVAALRARGLQVTHAEVADVVSKGARPFVAHTSSGGRLFVKLLGQEERDADLLYRAYRLVRLRQIGDVRPAASLRQAVEHQALLGLMAEKAGVRVPHVQRVVEAADGSAMIAMDLLDGRSLGDVPAAEITDDLLRELWATVARMHAARIAHRSLRTANVMLGRDGLPWIVDFSFSELSATDRQLAVDLAELLTSVAVLTDPERAVGTAIAVLGADAIGAAVPLLQPLALSVATRKAVRAAEGDVVDLTRKAAAGASGRPADELARVQRVRPRTLLMIAALAAAFYFLLPQLAQVDDAWRAFQSANFAWLPAVLALSALTYVGSALAVMGSGPQRLAPGPTLLAQVASSFANRVTPASVGGMVLNARFVQKSGVDTATAVAGVALSALVGFGVHLTLLVAFFAWSGSALGQAFQLPSASKLLLAVPIVAAVAGAVLLTTWGRRTLLVRLPDALRASAANLGVVAKSPAKLVLLFGGSVLTTLAYVGAFAASVAAFGGGVGFAKSGAVYLGAAALAAASPTPGSLGALEAALVAGLTGVGMAAGPAVSTVLAYRLATYWLPILPGWLAWNLMQRRNYI